jgi:hypothetical protein
MAIAYDTGPMPASMRSLFSQYDLDGVFDEMFEGVGRPIFISDRIGIDGINHPSIQNARFKMQT